MLLASAQAPGDAAPTSTSPTRPRRAINENYGRELLELHTVGLHYSEADVRNAAAAAHRPHLDEHQHYLFDDYIHPTGPMKVLGFTHPNCDADGGRGGRRRPAALPRHAPVHRARNLARKLCVRFVSDNPSAALVNAVADGLPRERHADHADGQDDPRSTEFWQSRGKKVRRPAENVIATIRALSRTDHRLRQGHRGAALDHRRR